MANLIAQAKIPLNPPLSKGEVSASEQGDLGEGGGIPLPSIPLTIGALAFARRKETDVNNVGADPRLARAHTQVRPYRTHITLIPPSPLIEE